MALHTAVNAGTEEIHFIPGSNEVSPEIDTEYMEHLKSSDQLEELTNFLNVRDYRNKVQH